MINQEEHLLFEYKQSYFFMVYDLLLFSYQNSKNTIDFKELLDLQNYILNKLENDSSLMAEDRVNLNQVLSRLVSYKNCNSKDRQSIFYVDDFIAFCWVLTKDPIWQSNLANIEQNKINFINILCKHQINLEHEIPISKQKAIYETIGNFGLNTFGMLKLCANEAKLSELPQFIQQKIISLLIIDCEAYKKNHFVDFTSYIAAFIDGLKKIINNFIFDEDDSLFKTINFKKVFATLYAYMDDKTVLAKNHHELQTLINKLEFLVPKILKNSNIWDFIGIHKNLTSSNLEYVLYTELHDFIRHEIQSLDPLRPWFNPEFVEELINKPTFEELLPAEIKDFHQHLEKSSAFTQKRKKMAKLECELQGLKYLLENHLISEKLTDLVSNIQLNNYASVVEKKAAEFRIFKGELQEIAALIANQVNLPTFVQPLLASTSERIKRCENLLLKLSQLVFYIKNSRSANLFKSTFPVTFNSIDGRTTHVFKNDSQSWALNFLRVAFQREHEDVLLQDFAEISRLINLLKRADAGFQKEVLIELSDLLRFHKLSLMSRQKFDVQNFMDLIFRQHGLNLKLFIRKEDLIQQFATRLDNDTCTKTLMTANSNILIYDQFKTWREFFINNFALNITQEGETALEKMVYFLLLTLFNNISEYSPRRLLINKTLYEFANNLYWLCKIYLMPETNYVDNKIIQPLNVTTDLRSQDLTYRAKELCKHFIWLTLTISKMPEPFKECCLTLYSREESALKLETIAKKFNPTQTIFMIRISNQTPGAVVVEIKKPSEVTNSYKLEPSDGQEIQDFELEEFKFSSADYFPNIKQILQHWHATCVYGNGHFHADMQAEEVNKHRSSYTKREDLVKSNQNYFDRTLQLMSDIREAKPLNEEELTNYKMEV